MRISDWSSDVCSSDLSAALAKVGLTPADVDGAFTGMPFDLISGLSVPEYFGIHPRITDNNRTGGSAFQTLAIAAALALDAGLCDVALIARSEEHTSELQSLMRLSYAVFCLKKKNKTH